MLSIHRTVSIVGSGPGAFYTAQRLLRKDPFLRVRIFERLTEPFGLVCFGIAPDHAQVRRLSRMCGIWPLSVMEMWSWILLE